MNNVSISFPGLGIGTFEVNSVAFTIPVFGGISVRWYGIFIVLGMIFAFFYTLYRAKKIGVTTDDVLDIALFIIPFGVVGARLYYVLTTLGEYRSFLDVIAIWNGGLAIYGGVIAGAITLVLVCRYKKLNSFSMMDCIGPGLIMAQSIGRWGNFMNGEAFGAVVSESSPLYFLRMGVCSPMSRRVFGDMLMHFVHPTFLYESVWNLIGFILINLLYRKKSFEGEVICWYIAWYGFGRMFIEGLRMDSLYVGPFRISQVVGFLCFVAGVGLVTWKRISDFKKKNKPEIEKREPESK